VAERFSRHQVLFKQLADDEKAHTKRYTQLKRNACKRLGERRSLGNLRRELKELAKFRM